MQCKQWLVFPEEAGKANNDNFRFESLRQSNRINSADKRINKGNGFVVIGIGGYIKELSTSQIIIIMLKTELAKIKKHIIRITFLLKRLLKSFFSIRGY